MHFTGVVAHDAYTGGTLHPLTSRSVSTNPCRLSRGSRRTRPRVVGQFGSGGSRGVYVHVRIVGLMPDRSRKRPTDLNALAASIVGDATNPDKPDPDAGKDPAAVSLGRRGGLKGGKARAAALTPEQRSAAAKKAAATRWDSSRTNDR